jgi:UDP-N-acetylglucosamine acyltransferase
MIAGHCVVEDHVIIGGITPVHQFVRIGRHAMVGGGLRVPKDVPPYILAGQDPLTFQGLNSVGLRRRGFTPEAITALDRAYAVLYQSGLNVSQAVERIREDAALVAVPEVQHLLEFIGASARGIIGGPRHRS